MRQQQVTKNSGSIYHFSLDSISAVCLSACQHVFRNHNNDFSIGVIVRRAIRQYLEKLEGAGQKEVEHEIIEARRAGKGII